MRLLVIVLASCLTLASAANFRLPPKHGCPEPIDTKPCTCFNSPYTSLDCQHLDDSEVLRNVFLNSARYAFKEVHISYSTLQYLPHEIFQKVPVRALYLKNVTLVQLFDSPPTALENLDTLHIENTKLLRGVSWKLFEPLTHLRILNIYYSSIKTIGLDFSEHVTKELRQISLYGTQTKVIHPGAFAEFTNLDKVAFENNKLTALTRDIFPVPFNARILHFSGNKLSSIPDDLFTDMPQLQTVGLRNNEIAFIPGSAFQGSLSKLEYLQLDGNPFTCDCRLNWLIQDKPPAISGVCDSPSNLKGKQIKDLQLTDLKC